MGLSTFPRLSQGGGFADLQEHGVESLLVFETRPGTSRPTPRPQKVPLGWAPHWCAPAAGTAPFAPGAGRMGPARAGEAQRKEGGGRDPQLVDRGAGWRAQGGQRGGPGSGFEGVTGKFP